MRSLGTLKKSLARLKYLKESFKRNISIFEAAKEIGSPSALSAGVINGNHIRSDALRPPTEVHVSSYHIRIVVEVDARLVRIQLEAKVIGDETQGLNS